MRLSAFRIKNYRSIIDTDWIALASDNITSLIGQNESGKTSILEGLNSFSNGQISEDILRSDLTLPMISAEFSLEKDEIEKFSSVENMPAEISAHIRKYRKITLNREWKNKNESQVFFGDDEILGEYMEKEQSEKKITKDLFIKASRILDETSSLVEEVNNEESERTTTQSQLTEVELRIDKLEKLIQRTRNERKRQSAQEELTERKKEQAKLKMIFDKTDTDYQKKSSILGGLIQKSEHAEKFLRAKEIHEDHLNKVQNIHKEIAELEERLMFTDDERQSQLLNSKIKESDLSSVLYPNFQLFPRLLLRCW
jgi:hypothetical protein